MPGSLFNDEVNLGHCSPFGWITDLSILIQGPNPEDGSQRREVTPKAEALAGVGISTPGHDAGFHCFDAGVFVLLARGGERLRQLRPSDNVFKSDIRFLSQSVHPKVAVRNLFLTIVIPQDVHAVFGTR
jgi:hypothetical protein